MLSYAFQGISRNGSTRAAKKGFHRASVYRAAKHDLTVAPRIARFSPRTDVFIRCLTQFLCLNPSPRLQIAIVPIRNPTHKVILKVLGEVFGDMNSRLVDLPDGEGIPKGPVEAWLLCDELICGKLPCVRSLNFREAEAGAEPTLQ